MNLAAPQPRSAKPAKPAPAAQDCGCADGGPQAAAALPRFLSRCGAGASGRPVQAKLVVGRQDDPFEREADAWAAAVVHGTPAQLPGATGAAPAVQRLCADCAAEQDEALVQRAADSAAPTTAGQHAPDPAADAGSPLAQPVRDRLEGSLGADLGHVRVHSGPAAQSMAQSLQAKAFTHGEHIWLGPQQRGDDLPLMAHEVAHVVQQGSGRARPDAVQRAPADHRHPEDGAGVLGRMQARISTASAGHEDEQPTGDASARAHSARSAAGQVDRGALAEQRAGLQPEARPSVDRPAQEAPKVQQAAAQTEAEAEAPAEPLVDAPGQQTPGQGGSKGRNPLADGGAGQAQAAFGAAASVAQPLAETPVLAPLPVSAPTDAGGQPLPGDAGADARVAGLAGLAQTLRAQSGRIRALAAEERGNAQTLRGNLALVRGGVAQAELGVTGSQQHLAFRQELLGQAHTGLGVSEDKAATVAAEAPAYASKADEGKAESGPMAAESGALAAENAANTPEDAEAAANAREQGQSMQQAGSDIGTTDDAVTQTRSRADGLGQEAAQAQQANQATRGKLEAMQAQLAGSGDKLASMGEQNAQARARMDALAGAPGTHTQQSAAIDRRGEDLAERSHGIEDRLQAVQADYAAGMAAVPAPEGWTPEKVVALYGPEAMGEEPAEPAPAETGAAEELVQRSPADSGEVEAPPPEPEPEPEPEAETEGGTDTGAAPSAPPDPGPQAPPEAAADAPPAEAADVAAPPPATAPTPERERVDASGAVSAALPSWLTGVEPPNEEARQRAADEAAARRQAQIDEIEGETGDGFAQMGATDRMGWALRQTGRNLFGSVGNIQWPGWGHLALGLVDPRGPLMGVVSGLGMVLSGGANLLSAEQWRRDPLGNLLKSAADIATGLTVVLGSITALAGVIIAIMAAITILSFGTAAPITGPVIAFCTTVLTTVGGWTIAVGKVALVLQALVLIKNLIDAACASTAAELQSEADQMTENVGDAANVLMQMGMAKAGQVGGRAAASEISAAGGGVRYAAQMGARAGVTARGGLAAAGRGLRALPAAAGRGVRAVPGLLRAGARAVPRVLRAGARAVPGVLRAVPGALRTGLRLVGRGLSAGGRALGRGALAGVRAVGRGASAGVRAVGRGFGAVGRGVRALPGLARSGLRGLPGAAVRGVRSLPGSLRAAWRGTRDYFGSRFSRSFIVGDDIANLGMARNASAEARAAVWAEARAPGGALAGEAGTVADDLVDDVADARPAGAADEAAQAAPEPTPSRVGDEVDIADTPSSPAAAREASVAESGHLPNERMDARRVRNEIDELNAHPERMEGTAPHRRSEVAQHEWREGGPSFCRFSPSRLCVDTHEVRAGHVAKAEARAAEAETDALDQARRAGEARARADAHAPLTPEDQAMLQAEIADAETRSTAARDALKTERGRATRAERAGRTDDAAAARERIERLLRERDAARADADAARELLDAPALAAREADTAEALATAAQREAEATARTTAKQRQFAQQLDELAAEARAIRARNPATRMMSTPDHMRLRAIEQDTAMLQRRLADEIEAASGLTDEARATLRAGTPFGGAGGRARESAFFDSLPPEARGSGGTYIDYVTGEARPLSELAVDHVISVDEIFRMDGFGRLPRADQLAILDLEANLRLLERGLNSSKQARTLTSWLGGEAALAPRLTPTARTALRDLEAECRQAVQDDIARRLARMRAR